MMPLRVLPMLLVAAGSLFLLKTAAMVVNGGLSLPAITPAVAQSEPAGGTMDKPQAQDSGQAVPPSGGEKPAVQAPKQADGEAGGEPKQIPLSTGRVVKPGSDSFGSKSAVLERLSQRSQELDRRARELDLKENLLKAAEKRLAAQLDELRVIKATIEKAQEEKEGRKKAQLKGLVTMYETMKAKDAARIFNGLKLPVLIELVDQMDARKMAEILGAMDREAAEKLTVALAQRGTGEEAAAPPQLPKIHGSDPG